MRISTGVKLAVAAAVIATPAHAQGRGRAAAAPAGPASLAGQWTGTYTSDVTQKGGRLVLSLAGSDESATGQLLLTPTGAKAPIMAEGAPAPARGRAATTGLSVTASKTGDDQVRGDVDGSYVDPGCNCSVVASFEGQISGNTLTGTISSRDARTGQWNFTSFTATKGGRR